MDNEDSTIADMFNDITGMQIEDIKNDLINSGYSRLDDIKREFLYVGINILLTTNLFISSEVVEEFKNVNTYNKDIKGINDEYVVQNPDIYVKSDIENVITKKIMKASESHVSKIKVLHKLLSLYYKDHTLLKSIYKKNVLDYNTFIGLHIQKELLLIKLKEVGNICITAPTNIINNAVNAASNTLTATTEVTQNAINAVALTISNNLEKTKGTCYDIMKIVKSIPGTISGTMSGTMSGTIIGGGITTTDDEEEIYRQKLIELLENVNDSGLLREGGSLYTIIDLFLSILNKKVGPGEVDKIIKDRFSTRLLGFILYYCEFIYILDTEGVIDTSSENTSGENRDTLMGRDDTTDGIIYPFKIIQPEKKNQIENTGGKKTKHRRRNKRKTKRKRKMK